MNTNKVQPVTPREVEQTLIPFPDDVLTAFNMIIAQNYRNGVSRFEQSEVVAAIIALTGKPRNHIFDNHWLDVETVYRRAGWKVEYDKPGYNETYEPTFTFTKKKSTRS